MKAHILIVEGGDILTPLDTQNMKLPFDQGWEFWAVVQGDFVVLLTPHFQLAQKTCSALNTMEFLV